MPVHVTRLCVFLESYNDSSRIQIVVESSYFTNMYGNTLDELFIINFTTSIITKV